MSKVIVRQMFGNNITPLSTVSGSDGSVLGKTNELIDLGTDLINGVSIGGNNHTHPNKYLLDGLNITSEEILYYYSSLINIPLLQEDW